MKKLISTLTAITMITAALPVMAYAEETENPDLKALASSLGADDYCLNIPNYASSEERPVPLECYYTWRDKATNTEFSYDMFNDSVNSGHCLGISLIEILCHNGIFSPSDVKSGASNLHELTYSDEMNKILTDYQVLQAHSPLDLYMHYLISALSYDEQISRTIEIAEKSMKEGKYFLINFETKKIYHAVTGIGITDGAWSFNGKTYDKCILTHDSNGVDEDGNTQFNEKGCIYINSSTNAAYIPAYDISSEDEFVICAIDDDNLLNYKGIINPSKSYDSEIDKLFRVTLESTNKINYDLSFYEANDKENVPASYLEGLFNQKIYMDKADRIEAFTSRQVSDDRTLTGSLNITTTDMMSWIETKNSPSKIIVENGKWHINSQNNNELSWMVQIRLNDDIYKFAPHYCWLISGESNTSDIELKDNGFLLKSDKEVKYTVSSIGFKYDENGNRDEPMGSQYIYEFIASQNVLLGYDEKDSLNLFIDKDGDEVYDDIVEEGDVNCDGKLDASDASEILSKYAYISTHNNIFKDLSQTYDVIDYFYMKYDFNGDGKVDASDASGVLAEYARRATIS